MKFIHLDNMDGRFHTLELSEHQAEVYASTLTVVEVEDRVYAAWQRHLDEAAAWDTLWTALSNEARAKRGDK